MCAFRKPIAVCLYLYIVISACFSFTLALSKTWIQDNNWETTRNWNLQRLPCAGDVVKIDLVNGDIFLNSTTTIKELAFQEESSIVLGNSAEVVFIEEHSDSNTCKGGEISFTGSGSSDWFDPNNWQTVPKLNEIGLYSQQLPCEYDVVTFPQDSSYNVKISKNVTVANVFINGKKHSEHEFQQYITSHTGIQQIQLNKTASFHITGKECADISGCVCDNGKYEDYICSFVTCPKLKCDQPVKPFAGCCSICGNLLLLNFSAGFNKASMEKQIQKYLKEFPEVIFTSTKYEEQRIQIILWDVSTSEQPKTFHAARSIRENLLADESMHIIAIEILPKKSSGSAAESKSTSVGTVTIGLIAAGAFVFVLVVLFIFILFKRKHSRGVNATNTEGETHNVENPGYLEEGVNPLYIADLEMDTFGFTNALAVGETSIDEDTGGKENPLYEPAKPAGD
ncbi:Hypothetical predicted protein [Paramuricea clavata]|uniref:Protein amnionless n=1 Tax=Paramuricea clavata TaxID=317549 RepID=A0A6S7GSH8_PARCT|nr:Hypothetical predicted protein [Paramuricea clavata]